MTPLDERGRPRRSPSPANGRQYMQINGTLQGNARTYLTHMFGRGLDDERYVVERFTSTADGEIRPFTGNRRSRGGRKRPRKVMSLRSVQRLRPERDEIIVCTGVNLKDSGVQMWGVAATGLFVDSRRR